MSKYLLLISLLLNSCEIFTDYRTITVFLPENSPPWFTGSNKTAVLVYPGESGQIERESVKWTGSFEIKIKKESFVPVVCYPSGILKPAGAIFPLTAKSHQSIQLYWEKGFLADLLLDILKTGTPIEHLNINRLSEEIEDKCNGDPWSLDRDLIREAIIYNALTVYKIKEKEFRDITLKINGVWISDNPFYPVSASNTQGYLLLKKISPGLHKFKNTETLELLDLSVKNNNFDYLLYKIEQEGK